MFKKIIIVVLILILIGIAGLYLFASKGLRPILETKLSEALEREVSIGSTSLSLPLKIAVNDVTIREKRFGRDKEFVKADRLFVDMNLLGLLLGKAAFNRIELVSARLNILRYRDGRFNFSDIIGRGRGKKSKRGRSGGPPVILSISIKNGYVEFVDLYGPARGLTTIFSDVNLDFGGLKKVKFNMSSKIHGKKTPKGAVKIGGWADILNKDMDAEFNLSKLYLPHFQPYFRRFVPAPLTAGWVNVRSRAKGKKGIAKIHYALVTQNVAFSESAGSGQQVFGIDMPTFIGLLQDSKGEINFESDVKLDFNKPGLDAAGIIGRSLGDGFKKMVARRSGDILLKIGKEILGRGRETTEGKEAPEGEAPKEGPKDIEDILKGKILDILSK